MSDVIISTSLKDNLSSEIDRLVRNVNDKLNDAANKFEGNIGRMQTSLDNFAASAKAKSIEIKTSFSALGTSFSVLANAIQRAAQAAAATGGGVGFGGNNAQQDTIKWLKEQISAQKKKIDQQKLYTNELQKEVNLLAEQKRLLKQQTTAMPTSMSGVMGMPSSNLNEIKDKMKAIRLFQATLPEGSKDIRTLNMEYAKLSKRQDEILGKNLKLTESNNALGRAFRYIANRLAFTLSIGAISGFVKQLYEVRGQYELLERSLGVLVNSFEKGSQIFNELNTMALKSPFTLIELGTAAKQLSAYNFAADEVVDTTKRLADISSALGVPMERLVYNLGQIKAQGVLNARDARDFANAGLAIVPMLAEMYTAQKRFGDEAVTTAQVYDMMKKKMVTYHDVLKVIYRVTDEGGKFFDFQAKQAGTLKVQLANLNLAWNNMLNDIGTEHQSALTKPIQLLKKLFENWRSLNRAISTIIVTLGTYKTISALVAIENGKIIAGNAIASLMQWVRGIKSATGAMATFNAVVKLNPIGLLTSLIAAAVGYFVFFKDEVEDISQDVAMFGENSAKALNKVESLYKILKGTDETSSTYKKTMEELNTVLQEYGIETLKESDNLEIINTKRKEAIELIKSESAERERANNLKRIQETYDTTLDKLQQNLAAKLKNATTGDKQIGILGAADKVNEELSKNADDIASIISSVVASNIDLIANKTGDDLEKGLDKIFSIIQTRMRAIGISEKTISKEWLETSLIGDGENIIKTFVNNVKEANEAQSNSIKITEDNYRAAKKATESTMTFTQKVDANSRALRNNAKDAVALYNKIMDIVKVAEQNHIINFDLKLTADNPPSWMFDKSLPELEKLARNFAAIAKSAQGASKIDINGTLFTREEAYERALQYASAAKEKQYKEEQKAQEDLNKTKNKTKKSNKSQKRSSDELAEALKNEISLIRKLQSEYDKLTKAGVTQQEALALVQDAYSNTLVHINATMRKYKLPEIDLSIIKGHDPNAVLKFFTTLRDILSSKGLSNVERMKAVEGVIEEFSVSAKTYNLEKITKGLNNELGKIKEEYELGVELDANPELGGIFADMMGISREEIENLPKDYAQVMTKLQNVINQKLGKGVFNLSDNLNKESFDKWVKDRGNELEDGFAKALDAIREYVNKIRLDETKKTIAEWNKLVEKYGEIQARILKIYKDSAQEQLDLAKAFGDEDEISQAIDLSNKIKISDDPEEIARLTGELEELTQKISFKNTKALSIQVAITQKKESQTAKAFWDDFKDSELYTMTFEDLKNVSTRSIKAIIAQLDLLKDKVKEDPASMKALMKSYEDARKELESRNPFGTIISSLKEWAEAAKQVKTANAALKKANKELEDAETNLKSTDPKNVYAYIAATSRYVQAKKQQKKASENATEAENNARDAQVKFSNACQASAAALNNASSLIQQFAEMLGIVEDSDADNAIKSITQGLGAMAAALGLAATMAMVLNSTMPYLAAIAAVIAVITAAFSFISNQSNNQINRQIKDSELAVKRLTTAYKELEHAASKAYGVQEYGAQKAMIANKKLQLQELEYQLELEQGRDGKHRDEETILDLKGQIIDLKNEIADAAENIVNDLLGISSKGDFAENMVKNMIEAFKQGEDYMKIYEESFEDMVDNMIMKAIVSKLVGQYIDKIWDAAEKATKESPNAKYWEQKIDYFTNALSSSEGELEELERLQLYYKEGLFANEGAYNDVTQRLEMLKNMRENWQKGLDFAIEAYNEALTITPESINEIRDMIASGKETFKDQFESWMAAFGIQFGQDAGEMNLSALQQGITNISETTAEALEAYMNSVSQQVYYQSDILTQIRDILVNFGGDITIATNAQILFELQQSYQVQMSIQSILQGWSNASGLAVRVELAN